MTSIPALEAEIKDACRAWVASGKRLVRGAAPLNCGCALDALAWMRTGSSHAYSWKSLAEVPAPDIMRGFDYGPGEHANPPARELGARIAAWAEQEGLL